MSAEGPPITHIVLFAWPSSVEFDERMSTAKEFLALKENCRLPDGTRYIVSLEGGTNNSPECKAKGLQDGFVVVFRSFADREYYLKEDPVHLAFAANVGAKVSDVVIFDFAVGQFLPTS